MSIKDLSRFDILTKVKTKDLKQLKVAKILGLSSRQIRRLLKRLSLEGSKGLISKKLGIPSNHKVSRDQENVVLGFLRQEDRHDFGPTLTYEYLCETGNLNISVSFVRNIVIRNGLWEPNHAKKPAMFTFTGESFGHRELKGLRPLKSPVRGQVPLHPLFSFSMS